jgi:transposase-like protein
MLPHILPFVVLILLLSLLLNDLHWFGPAPAPPASKNAWPKAPCPLRPRTPDDCPACSAESTPSIPPPITAPVPAWCELKSRRGAPKRINTQGFTCPNSDCLYHTDAHHHALVGDVYHGQAEPIQDLRCQACQQKFTVHHDTPMYRLKTSAARIALVLTALAEGLSVFVAVHAFGHRERTITTWLGRAGTHAERLHGRIFRNLQLLHVQLDVLRTTLRDKGHELCCGLRSMPKPK